MKTTILYNILCILFISNSSLALDHQETELYEQFKNTTYELLDVSQKCFDDNNLGGSLLLEGILIDFNVIVQEIVYGVPAKRNDFWNKQTFNYKFEMNQIKNPIRSTFIEHDLKNLLEIFLEKYQNANNINPSIFNTLHKTQALVNVL